MKSPPAAAAAPSADTEFDALAQQILSHLSQGATLGDLRQFRESDYEVMYALGHSLYTQGRFTEAVQVFGFLVMHNHFERRFLMALAAATQMTKDYGTAVQLYTLAAVQDPTDPLPCFHTCECLLGLGMRNEAREGLVMVIQQCTGDAQSQLRARAEAMLGLLNTSTSKEAS